MFDKQARSGSDGVSPVIGVILMVAITVILAAVIATFVLNLSGNLQQGAQASVTFDEDPANDVVDVRLVNVQNADFVEIRAEGGSGSVSGGSDLGGANTGQDLGTVGESLEISYSSSGSGTATAVGYLEAEGSTLQTYEYGG